MTDLQNLISKYDSNLRPEKLRILEDESLLKSTAFEDTDPSMTMIDQVFNFHFKGLNGVNYFNGIVELKTKQIMDDISDPTYQWEIILPKSSTRITHTETFMTEELLWEKLKARITDLARSDANGLIRDVGGYDNKDKLPERIFEKS